MQKQLKFGLTLAEIKIIQDTFEKIGVVEKVLIYGSRAKGNYKQFSDIDLCVLDSISTSDLASLKRVFEDSNLIYQVDLHLFKDISNEELKVNILKDGKIIFPRQ
jgi:predicted nucleotidyltransferase